MIGVVVGAAVISDGKVLAARRTAPPSLAGRWEFPGGKVERDESEPEALARELREELALDVRVGELLARAPMADGRELALYLSHPTGGDPQPAGNHDCVRWLAAGELSSVLWLDADLLCLDAVGRALHA